MCWGGAVAIRAGAPAVRSMRPADFLVRPVGNGQLRAKAIRADVEVVMQFPVVTTAVMCCVVAAGAHAQGSLPNPSRTPGATGSAVTQENIGETICVRGWTRTVRPPEEFTFQMKRWQVREWRYENRRLRDYAEDHLVPLALGRAPDDARNLWPEPRVSPGGWGAGRKDALETALASSVAASCRWRRRRRRSRRTGSRPIGATWLRRREARCTPARAQSDYPSPSPRLSLCKLVLARDRSGRVCPAVIPART